MSKYGETFIEKREQKLQSWLSRIAHHPVLARDQYALKHFLTCPTSDTKVWRRRGGWGGGGEGANKQFVLPLILLSALFSGLEARQAQG